MINFGVTEVPNSTVPVGPGWAYIPDTSSGSASQLSARNKRLRLPTASLHETNAKQEAKILRDIAALDKESNRDVSIPVPVRHRDNAGRASHGKVTPAVRKILQSQKTFANHLADYDALSALNASQPSQPTIPQPPPSGRATPSTGTPQPVVPAKRAYKKRGSGAPSGTPLKQATPASTPAPTPKIESSDTAMADAPNLYLGSVAPPPPHPEDGNPLLISRVPQMPTQEEVEALLAAPALGYHEARGSWTAEDQRKPVRRFCEVCGYWGRARCGRCGGRVCALECLGVHQEECFTRYGA